MTDKYASEWPLPGGVEQYFDTLLRLLRHVQDNLCEHEALAQWTIGQFSHTTQSKAVSRYLDFVGRMDLWATKDDLIRLTPGGLAVVEKAAKSPDDAKRAVLSIKLQSISGYDVLLMKLRQGPCSFDDLDSHLKQALGASWESKNQTMFRVNWLRSLGYAQKSGLQYSLTEAGRKVIDSGGIPPIKGSGPTPPEPAPKTALVRAATTIADRITKAASDGGDGKAFEDAVAEAFVFLGYTTQVISGAGNPDIVAYAQLGEASYRILVETKSRANGTVQQNDVNFNALKEHKAKSNADHTVVIGAEFSGGNLVKWACEHTVRLMRTEELRQVLLAYAEAVLPLDSLKALFVGGGPLDEATLSQVLGESASAAQAMVLAREVYNAVREHQHEEGMLDENSLFYILRGEYPKQEIATTIGLLRSDLIGALSRTDKGSLCTRLAPRGLMDKINQIEQTLRLDQSDGEGVHPA